MFAKIALTLVPILKGHGKKGGQGTGAETREEKKKGREVYRRRGKRGREQELAGREIVKELTRETINRFHSHAIKKVNLKLFNERSQENEMI